MNEIEKALAQIKYFAKNDIRHGNWSNDICIKTIEQTLANYDELKKKVNDYDINGLWHWSLVIKEKNTQNHFRKFLAHYEEILKLCKGADRQ